MAVAPSDGQPQSGQAAHRRKVPSWLVSFVVHLVLLLILAATPIKQLASGPLTLLLGSSASLGMAAFELSGDERPPTLEALDAQPTTVAELSDPAKLLQVELPTWETALRETGAQLTTLPPIPFGISNGLTGRSGALKEALLSKFGGSHQTQEAVELGLQWLAKQQKSNGSWSLVGPYSDGGVSENATAATALALNAFLGNGVTHQQGQYREQVRMGIDYLVKKQDKDGYFPDPREPSRQQMYAQAIASITIAEAYGMTGDSALREAAQRAMKFAAWSQSKLRGWRYEPQVDADLSVTGWYVMALETGKMAGLQVDEEVLQSVNEFLDSVSFEENSR
ncbi:MAG: hypothetical protein KDA45_01265, partial [Planctomycetales bacterium]|nr:hypothetical protein [Planctomycetales bacterium]